MNRHDADSSIDHNTAANSDSMDDRLDRALEDVEAGRVETFDNDEDFMASLDESPAAHTDLAEQEQAVIDAARLFVMSTSYYRQRKESREAFERLAFALLDLRKAIDADS